MKWLLVLLCINFSYTLSASSKIGTINNPDGYANVQALENTKSKVVEIVHENEYFNYFENPNSDWWLVQYKNSYGYLHKNSIKPIRDGYFYTDGNVMVTAKKVDATVHTYPFTNITVKIIQLSAENESFYCKAVLQTIQDNNIIATASYTEIEPVGDNYGITPISNQPSSKYFLLLKLGDYDGNLLVVDTNGYIKSYPGGAYFITKDQRFLVSEYQSDLSGLTIVDLENNNAYTFEPEYYFRNWYVLNNTYYFEADYGLDGTADIRMLAIDFTKFSINPSKLTPKQGSPITLTTNTCNCK